MWTACGDSIVRAFDAKSGSLKRQFVGHEAAVNCMTITGGKLYTGSSDGTLRIWDAKDVADDGLGDDGPPPPVPTEAEGEDVAEAVDATAEDTPAEESEAVPEEENPEETVEDIENGEGETPAEGEEPAGEEGETPPAEDGEEAPAEEEPAKDADDIDAMEQELADAAG